MSLNPPQGFIPVCSLGMSQIGRMNLGKDASTFKYYTMCGLQEGFEPFAVNMNREITMWFSKRLPTFVIVPQDNMHIEVTGIVSHWLSNMHVMKINLGRLQLEFDQFLARCMHAHVALMNSAAGVHGHPDVTYQLSPFDFDF